MSNKKNRRQFLKNASLAAASIGLITKSVQAAEPQPDMATNIVDCNPTTLDLYGQGPFYTENAPTLPEGKLASDAEAGNRLIISGRVFNLECNEAIPNAIIDLWHADNNGAYDNEGYNLRGKITSNSQGFYMFESILPGKYLNGNQFRPAHIHVKVTPPGFDTLTTQIYFEGDEEISTDAAASVTSGTYDATNRIIALSTNADAKLEGTWDIVVNGDGVNNLANLHLDKGIIYNVSPNPFSDTVEISYGVFQAARTSLQVYDMSGRLMANLDEQQLSPEKYTAVWSPGSDVPAGHYFITLKINDLQVHYLKVVRL